MFQLGVFIGLKTRSQIGIYVQIPFLSLWDPLHIPCHPLEVSGLALNIYIHRLLIRTTESNNNLYLCIGISLLQLLSVEYILQSTPYRSVHFSNSLFNVINSSINSCKDFEYWAFFNSDIREVCMCAYACPSVLSTATLSDILIIIPGPHPIEFFLIPALLQIFFQMVCYAYRITALMAMFWRRLEHTIIGLTFSFLFLLTFMWIFQKYISIWRTT